MQICIITDSQGKFVTVSNSKDGAMITANELNGSVFCYDVTPRKTELYSVIFFDKHTKKTLTK